MALYTGYTGASCSDGTLRRGYRQPGDRTVTVLCSNYAALQAARGPAPFADYVVPPSLFTDGERNVLHKFETKSDNTALDNLMPVCSQACPSATRLVSFKKCAVGSQMLTTMPAKPTRAA